MQQTPMSMLYYACSGHPKFSPTFASQKVIRVKVGNEKPLDKKVVKRMAFILFRHAAKLNVL